MGARKRRAADRAGRPAMRSPGRPPVGRREHRQRFWWAIARGLPSEDAGVAAGVSPAWDHAGSVKAVACQPSAAPRCQGATCRSPSEKSSPSSVPKTSACARPRGGWGGPRRPSPGSCAATPRPVVGGWSIGPRPRSGTPTGVPGAPRSPSWLPTSGSGLCAAAAGGRDHAARRHGGAGPGGRVDRSAARASQGSPVGALVESGADRGPAAGRLGELPICRFACDSQR
jgi:hypothetical protein